VRPKLLVVALSVALAAAAVLVVPAAPAATEAGCGKPCNIVRSNLMIGWRTAKSYAASHGGSFPRGRAFVNAILDVTAGLDPGVGTLARAERLNDPAAVLIDPGSTARRLLLWGRAANGVVVQLTGTLKSGPAFRYLDA
jgi:hypothetical protein